MADNDDEIKDAPLAEALGERYLAYALSTIMHRALPDVRDGLKPVHRRVLYTMRQMGLGPNTPAKKSAKVVGEVMGNYHPHGDQAIYDALVRLAQPFAMRYPLVEGQGNFGNIDGDNAAAMRYTECRLSKVAEAILDGIDEDAVDFRPTFDGSSEEPVVLPGAFPNLLANGSTGIAVGMATSIPPHNVHEICDALLFLLKTPDAPVERLMRHIPGPDFPTGGTIIDDQATILEAYRTGRGGFRVRARWIVEEKARGTYTVVITEIPYQVQKSKLIERIAELIEQKKAPLLADVRDESAEDIRVVLEPKSRAVDPKVLMESLFRLSDLEARIPLNLNVLDKDHVPRVMSLAEALVCFLHHRREVLLRRTRFRLGKIEARLEILAGLLVAYLNLDEVIRIIRYEDEPKAELMRVFALSDVQAEAILNMRLRNLRKLEEMEIKREQGALLEEKAGLEALLGSVDLQDKRLADEVRDIKERFGKKTKLGARRTDFADPPDIESDAFDAIEREPITVICSKKGWIRVLKGHVDPHPDVKYKEGDEGRYWLKAESTDKIIVFATNGRFYTLAADRLPGGRGAGEPIRLMIDLADEDDIIAMFVHDDSRRLLLASSAGHGFLVAEAEVVAQKRSGKQILTLGPEDGAEPARARVCLPVAGDPGGQQLALLGEAGRLLVLPLAEVTELTKGRGTILQRFAEGGLADAVILAQGQTLGVEGATPGGRIRTLADLAPWRGRRGGTGKPLPKGLPQKGYPAAGRLRVT